MPPNGVSIRFPPARGFAGSAVWQLPQSPVSLSALPSAIVSAEGSASARPRPNAVHKIIVARIACVAPCHPCINRSPATSLCRETLGRALRRFATALGHDTTRKRDQPHWLRNCVLLPWVYLPQICDAGRAKTDKDWF